MKKKIFKLLTGMLLSCALAGSTVAVQAEEAGTDTVKSYLTGEDVSVGIGHRRPIAVMLGNDTNGAPQSGTENAGVIYEAPVEGSITRLMAIIEDYDNIPRIGSVRSCRDYFLFYANEYDAIYSHYGQAVYALQYLDQHLIDNLHGLTLGNAYYRSTMLTLISPIFRQESRARAIARIIKRTIMVISSLHRKELRQPWMTEFLQML